MDMAAVNEQVISDFRAGGEISVEGMHRDRLVLLTTVGEKTFEPSTVPVMFTTTDAGILVVASNDGAHDEPQWYRNLVADPVVHVEEPTHEYDGAARVLAQKVRDAAWTKLTADYPFFLDQQRRADAPFPHAAGRPWPFGLGSDAWHASGRALTCSSAPFVASLRSRSSS